jgi:hypothetical protein
MIVPPSSRVPPRKKTDDLAVFVITPALCSVAVGVLLIGSQCLHWLQFATWRSVTLQDAIIWAGFLPPGRTGMAGLDELLWWGLGTPVSSWLILVFPVVWVFLTEVIWLRAGQYRGRS